MGLVMLDRKFTPAPESAGATPLRGVKDLVPAAPRGAKRLESEVGQVGGAEPLQGQEQGLGSGNQHAEPECCGGALDEAAGDDAEAREHAAARAASQRILEDDDRVRAGCEHDEYYDEQIAAIQAPRHRWPHYRECWGLSSRCAACATPTDRPAHQNAGRPHRLRFVAERS